MNDKNTRNEYPDCPGRCEIRLKGRLDDRWAGWFGDVILTPQEDGDTLITGVVADQAALHGLLKRIRDLGIPLLSVNFVHPDRVEPLEEEP